MVARPGGEAGDTLCWTVAPPIIKGHSQTRAWTQPTKSSWFSYSLRFNQKEFDFN